MDESGAFNGYSDEQLAVLAKDNTKAATELTSRLFPSIRALAVSINPQISDDLLQEGLLGMLSAIGSYDENRGSVRTYALTCARNRMLSTVKQNSLLGGDVDRTDELEDKSADAQSEFEQRERFLELYSAMERCLTKAERDVLTCYMMGCSYAEIAKRLAVSVKSVDNAMQRARRKLRREFS